MVKVISTINLKGGVGKTSTTIALAEFLATEHGKKVLLVDLDPQTNATVALIDQGVWEGKDQRGETLYQMFYDKIVKTSRFDIDRAIVRKVSNVGDGIEGLDLLPSSLRLIDIQDEIPSIPEKNFNAITATGLLQAALSRVADSYDYILIDCPPNLGTITLNGIQMSDYYLIPCIPDILSTYGLPQILARMKAFKEQTRSAISPLGIVITMYRKQSRLHDSQIGILKNKHAMGQYPRVFDTIVPMNVRAASSVEYGLPFASLRQKYGVDVAYEHYSDLTREFMFYAGN